MARPIEATPILSDKEIELFLEIVERQLSVQLKTNSASRKDDIIAKAKTNGFFKSQTETN